MEFWGQLKEDSPDLMKLSDIGTQLNLSLQNLDLQWLKLTKMNLDIPPNIMRTYAKFLIDVANDKETAADIIKKINITT